MLCRNGLHALELIAVEHAGRLRRVVQVAAEDIPAREDQVFELSDRRQVLDQRRVVVGPLAQPDRSHLRHRSNRLGKSSANCFYSGDQRGRHRAHAGNHDSKFSCCWLDARCIRRRGVGCRHCDTYPSYRANFQISVVDCGHSSIALHQTALQMNLRNSANLL